MKKISVLLAISAFLILTPVAYAQSDTQAQYRSAILQLIGLLMEQIRVLQQRIAEIEKQNTIVIPPPNPVNTPTGGNSTPEVSAPVDTFRIVSARVTTIENYSIPSAIAYKIFVTVHGMGKPVSVGLNCPDYKPLGGWQNEINKQTREFAKNPNPNIEPEADFYMGTDTKQIEEEKNKLIDSCSIVVSFDGQQKQVYRLREFYDATKDATESHLKQ